VWKTTTDRHPKSGLECERKIAETHEWVTSLMGLSLELLLLLSASVQEGFASRLCVGTESEGKGQGSDVGNSEETHVLGVGSELDLRQGRPRLQVRTCAVEKQVGSKEFE
jgi:hypothetical protein